MALLEYLEISACALWAVAYIALIRRQHRDKSFLLPLCVLAANFSWEILHAGILLAQYPSLGRVLRIELGLELMWVGLDIILIWQTLRYATAQSPSLVGRYTLRRFGILFAACMVVHVLVDAFSNDWLGSYSGFTTDIFLFVMVGRIVASRRDNRGVCPSFFVLTFVADLILITSLEQDYGVAWFVMAFRCCRVLVFVYCMGMYARNRWIPERSPSPTTASVSSAV